MPNGLTWGRLYDFPRVESIEVELESARELPASRASVLRAAARVAWRSGAPGLARRLVAGSKACSERPSDLVVRDGTSFGSYVRKRLLLRMAFVLFLPVVISLVLPLEIAAAGTVLLSVLAFHSIRRHRRWSERIERLAAANEFSAPPPWRGGRQGVSRLSAPP
jgi:hypothetical protein